MFRGSLALGVDGSGNFPGLLSRTTLMPERCIDSNVRCILVPIAVESWVPSEDAPYRIGTRHRASESGSGIVERKKDS
jgi:hypothetical protein